MPPYRGNFEVHLTVRAAGSDEAFRAWCETAGCKCVRIVLSRGAQVDQPMATWRRAGTELQVVRAEALRRVEQLERAGFVVARVKIEADPSNEDVPATDEAALLAPAGNYFEHHAKLQRATDADCGALLQVCDAHAAHLSRNAWRRTDEGLEERFVTLRSHRVGRSTSAERLRRLLASLAEIGEQVVEVESEYAVHDSNLQLDAGWLPDDAP